MVLYKQEVIEMKCKYLILKQLVNVLNRLVIFSVNSACILGLGQPLEPKSLERFKKDNNEPHS